MDEISILFKRLKELDLNAESFKKQKDLMNIEAKKWADRRDSLNLKKSEIWNEIKLHKDERDKANQAVKELKEKRSEIISQINEKREEYRTLEERAVNLFNGTSQNVDHLKRRINELEWEIQTNSLSKDEENLIIEQIRTLEKWTLTHKDDENLREKLIEIKEELDSLKIKSNEIHKQITELAKKSQENHNKMIEKLNEGKLLKEEADEVHRKYIDHKESADELHRKYIDTLDQIRLINTKIKTIEELKKGKRLSQEIETMSEIAFKKLKEKKKLTLDEFKILKNKGLI